MATDKNENNLNKDHQPSTYTSITVGEIKEVLIKQILKSQHGRDKEVDARIEKAWKKRYEQDFKAVRVKGEMPLPLLHGPSAVGKSRIIDSACLEVAEMLGMTPVINPKGRRSFTKDEMVIGKLNFKASGDIPFLLVGMVSINDQKLDDGSMASYTSTIPNDIVYSVSKNAGAGIRVLFVDEVNSGDVASAAFMALHDNDLGSDIDVGETFMVGAGNLGEEDGNLASANPVSMSTRAWNFMVSPELKNWIDDYVTPNFLSDTTGDFGVSLYLKLNPDKFNEKPPKASDIEGVSTVYGVPRTWAQLITTLESQFGSAEMLGQAGIKKVANVASGIVGPAAIGYAEFAYRLWTGVAPMVEEFMSEKGPSAATIKKFSDSQQEGRSSAEKDFMHQWAYQCSLTAASHIVHDLEKAGLSEGFDFATDKSNGGKKLDAAKAVFKDIGDRFGGSIAGIKSPAMINSASADVVNQMARITTSMMPWLREEGGLKGIFRSEFLHGAMDKLAKSGMSKQRLEDISRIYFGNRLQRPDAKTESTSAPKL